MKELFESSYLSAMSEENNRLRKEIERLTELCNKYEEEHKTTFETWQKDIKENEQLHSIIKEIREYIETHLDNTFKTEFDYITTNPQELLEILDKVEKVGEDNENN